MATELHSEGLEYILGVMFGGLQSIPENFYLGWCTNTALAENASLGAQTELSGNGYARVAIASDTSDWTAAAVSTDAYKVTSKVCTFTASGGAWSSAKTWFVATSSDDTGQLIASGPINGGTGVALTDGQSYDLQAVITLTVTAGWTQQGLQYLLRRAFREEYSAPSSFYVGLGTNTSLATNATMSSITELSGNGYAREAVTNDSASWRGEGIEDADYRAVADEVTFTADGGDWSRAKIGFLCSTASGTGGWLAGWWPVQGGSGHIVEDEASYDVEAVPILTG